MNNDQSGSRRMNEADLSRTDQTGRTLYPEGGSRRDAAALPFVPTLTLPEIAVALIDMEHALLELSQSVNRVRQVLYKHIDVQREASS